MMYRVFFPFAVILASATALTSCISPGQVQEAVWQNSRGETCSWVGEVGVNIGTNAQGSEYVLALSLPAL